MRYVRHLSLNTPLPRSPIDSDEDDEVTVPAYVPVLFDASGRPTKFAVRAIKTTWRHVKDQLESQMDRYDELPKEQRDAMKLGAQPWHPYELQDLRRLDPKTKL